jgi:hypothetical protein
VILKKKYDSTPSGNEMITFKMIRSVLKTYIDDEFSFKFLPHDLSMCLSESDETIESILRYFV